MQGANFIVFFIAILLLSLVLFYLTSLYAVNTMKNHRLRLFRAFYECGFSMTPDTYQPINLQFQSLLLIFLVYDMEIVIFTPILLNLSFLPLVTLLYWIFLLIIFGASYLLEWDKYSLTWHLN